MAFDPSDLLLETVTAHGYLYLYETTDNLATVNGSGYWHSAGGLLRPNDEIAVTASDGKFWGIVFGDGGVATPGVFNRADATAFHF